MKVRAQDIKYALSQKHKTDFFLTEVKNGSTWMSKELAIMDGLAIKKSWTKPCLTGYEIKVSRSDFMNDEKWPVYKDLCHRFYFACPKGLIQPDEIPEDVGLVYFNPENKSLYTRKKSKFRNIEMSADLFYYIILSRLENESHPFFSSQRELLEQYVLDKVSKRELAFKVGTKMAKQLNELEQEISNLKRENERFHYQSETLETVQKILKKHGMRVSRWEIERELESALSTSVPPQLIQNLQTIQQASTRLLEIIKKE